MRRKFFCNRGSGFVCASTPFAKQLLGSASAIAGGSALSWKRAWTDQRAGDSRRRMENTGLSRTEWPWLLGAILFGGVFEAGRPAVRAQSHRCGSASLLLNLESVLTALLAWIVFRENADRRIIAGMLPNRRWRCGTVWPYGGGTTASGSGMGQLLVAGACLCWAVDNNLTRKCQRSIRCSSPAARG